MGNLRKIKKACGHVPAPPATPKPEAEGERIDLDPSELEAILERMREFEVQHIVVGYPLNMDGSRGPACAAVDRFVATLRKRAGVPVTLVDETLSSFAAEEMGKEIEGDFRKRRKFLDSVAAQIILESFFEKEIKR